MKSKAIVAAAMLFCLGVALAVFFAATGHAAATGHDGRQGGGGDSDEYPWDTDNLRYGRYNAKSFNIPFHDYSGYSGVEACQKNVADGFFQTGSPDVVSTVEREDELTPEDFPVLVFAGGVWGVEAEASADNDSGCDSFVSQQEEMVSQISGNGGYYLDASGSLKRLSGNSVLARFSGRSFSYGSWTNKGSRDFTVRGAGAVRNTSGYLDRVDGYGKAHAIYPVGTSLSVPETTTDGDFGSGLHGTTVSGGFVRVAVPSGGVGAVGYLPYGSGLCPSGFHPRGEDSHERIGGSTGRTLSGLSHSVGKTADKYWCRSDVRYLRSFKAEHHGDNISRHSDAAPAGSIFEAYGRLNCYYTSSSVTTLSNGGYVCGYYFPVPQCDTDTDNSSNTDWRDYTAKELKDIADDLVSGKFNKDEGEACPPDESKPQCTAIGGTKRDFTKAELDEYKKAPALTPADDGSSPCVKPSQLKCTASGGTKRDFTAAELTEYRKAPALTPSADGSSPCRKPAQCTASNGRIRAFTAAELAEYRTVPAVTPAANGSSPCAKPNASEPPRLAGFADNACVTASLEIYENAVAGSAAGVSPHPSHSKGFASAGTDYTGAVENIAHRYASKAAENSCAAVQRFAELVLEILEGRRLVFQDYIDSYEARVDAAIRAHNSYSPNIRTGTENSVNAYANLSLEEMRQNALERQREKYVNDRKAYLDSLKAALTNAESVYLSATNSTQMVLRAVSVNGCVDGYNRAGTGEIDRLKDIASAAESAFPSSSVARSVALSNKAYDATGSASSTQTGGTDFFERKYNALSVLSYENLVPAYSVIALPPSDARPADSSLTWTLGTWSGTSRTYSCAHLSDHFLNTYQGDLRCLKQEERTASPSESCPSALPEGATSWRVVQGFLGKRCLASDSDGDEVASVSVTYSCSSGWTLTTRNVFQVICTRQLVVGNLTPQHRDTYTRTDRYNNVVSGTVTGTLQGTTGKKADFARTYTGSRVCEYATGTIPANNPASRASRTAPACGTITHNLATGTSATSARAVVVGTAQSNSVLPADAVTTSQPASLASITEASLLGKLYPRHPSRNTLLAAAAADRNTAAANLGSLTQTAGTIVSPSASAAAVNSTAGGTSAYAAGFVPSGNTVQRTAISRSATAYINEYAKAYDSAYSGALSDMGSTATTTVWNNFAWSYETSSLVWSGYVADERQPSRSRGCYLIDVAGDGKVSVQTARMDFETGSYAVGETYSVLGSGDRDCKIRRTRTPELNLEYQPAKPTSTDTSLTAADFHVDYQPTSGERFKFHAETEVFAVRAKVADSPPVF